MKRLDTSSAYRRLDSERPPDPDHLEDDDKITSDLFKDKYDVNQFKPIPWKGILLATFLFLLGSVVLSLGILILTNKINAEHDQGFSHRS